MAVKYTLCPLCSYPVPEGETICPRCGAPLPPKRPSPPTPSPNFFSPAVTTPLIKRAYRAVFERHRGLVVTAFLAILLLTNIVTLVLAIPYVKEKASEEMFVESRALISIPSDPLSHPMNISYELWPGVIVSSSGMLLLNITLREDAFVMPPEVYLTTPVGGVVSEARLFVQRGNGEVVLHALFYPLPSAGLYLIKMSGLGERTLEVSDISITESGIVQPLISDPLRPEGEGIGLNISGGFRLFLDGVPVSPEGLGGRLNSSWQHLIIKGGSLEFHFLLKEYHILNETEVRIRGSTEVTDTFSMIDYNGSFYPGQVVEITAALGDELVALPTVVLNNGEQYHFGIVGDALKVYTALPQQPTGSESVYLRQGDERVHIQDLKLNLSLAPLYLFLRSPFNGSDTLKVRLLRYTLFTPVKVIIDGIEYDLPGRGENRTVVNGEKTVVIERGAEDEVFVLLKGRGAVEVGYRLRYTPSIPFFLLVPLPPYILGLPQSASGSNFLHYFYLLVVIILGSAALLSYQTLREWKRRRTPPENWKASRVSLAFLASLFFSLSTARLMNLLNTPITTPESFSYLPNWLLLTELASASVYEELVARVLLIGVPVALIALLKSRRGFIRSLLGGYDRWDHYTIFFVFFSAALFGLAHSSGWGPWKVIPTFLGGLLFGYVYVKVGLHGSILMHFATDYLLAFTYLFGGKSLLINLAATLLYLSVVTLSYLYGIHFAGEFLEAWIRRKLPGKSGSTARLLLITSIPVILLFLLIWFIGRLGLLNIVLFSVLTLTSLALIFFCIIARFIPLRPVKALGIVLGAVGALLSFPFAPLAVPHLIEMIKTMK